MMGKPEDIGGKSSGRLGLECAAHPAVLVVRTPSKGAGTPYYYPLYTARTLFYFDYFVGVLWAHLTTNRSRIFLYFVYLQG